MKQPSESQRLEAASAETPLARLRVLMRAHDELAQLVAAHPNCSLKLLDDLAHRFPCQVLANSGLSLQLLESPNLWSRFSLRSLVALFCTSSSVSYPALVQALRSKLSQVLTTASGTVTVTNRETWIFSTQQRAAETEGLTDLDPNLELQVKLVQLMAGTSEIELTIPGWDEVMDDGDCPVKKVLTIISRGDLEHLIAEPYIEDPWSVGYRDIEMHEPERQETYVDVLAPDGYSAKGNQVRGRRSKKLFSVEADYNNPDAPFVGDQILYVGVSDEQCDTQLAPPGFDSADLGALGQLWSWTPPVLAPEHAVDWIDAMVDQLLALEH